VFTDGHVIAVLVVTVVVVVVVAVAAEISSGGYSEVLMAWPV
jgi:hypothetical protein